MSCGGRIYKGGMTTISIPFDVEGYSNLSVSYYTSGDFKITKTEEDLEIADGFITYTFTKEELDLLPDGVIYYSISYEVDGVDYMESTNTPLYLKTPAGYSGTTLDDIWQSAFTSGWTDGYQAGLAACQSGTPINNVLVFYASGGTWSALSQRDLQLDGVLCPYPYTKDGGPTGWDIQFNLQSPSQIPTPSSIRFTVDKHNLFPTPDLGIVAVFGEEVEYTYTVTTTSGLTEDETGLIYDIQL